MLSLLWVGISKLVSLMTETLLLIVIRYLLTPFTLKFSWAILNHKLFGIRSSDYQLSATKAYDSVCN
jgi:hypothetical protein